MIILEQADYEKLAGEAVAAYHNSGTPLNDSLYKVASDMGLNPDQVKQLVWGSNTKLHLDLFSKQAEDKMIEFPVADADYILRRLYTPPEAQPLAVSSDKVASDFFSSPLPVTEKVAHEEFSEEVKEVSVKTAADRRAKEIILMRKAASELDIQTQVAREQYTQAISELARELRKMGAQHDEFEKDAYAFYGDAVVPMLQDVRHAMNVKTALETEKIACNYERVIDTDSPEMQKLAEIKKAFDEAVKCGQAFVWLQKELGSKGIL